jgi:NagD protein
MKTGYLIDMDGVIYRANELIPGAQKFIIALIASGAPFVFLTNNSSPTPEDLSVRLGHLGLPGLSPRHFYTSALNTAEFLSETHPACTVFVIGEGGLQSALHERKIANDAIQPSYVVVGEGAVSMEKLAKAHTFIEHGARLLATNPDNWCPVSGDGTRPGTGSTAAFLEASTGRRAYYLGKPNGYMFHRARRKLAEMGGGTHPENIIVIGDTMETDIRGAIEADLQAYLVLSGATTLDAVPDYVYQPTRVLNSIADLIEELESGKPSSRLDSPVYQKALSARPPSGNRHQTDAEHPAKFVPRPPMTR